MSAQKTKFPVKKVPNRSIHQGTTIVGKNGLPVDALATLEPGSTLVSGQTQIQNYSAPTVTVNNSIDLEAVKAYAKTANFKHTGKILFTDTKGVSYLVDVESIDNQNKTFDIYSDENLTNSPINLNLNSGWILSEGELVNRLQTTSSAVIDSVEFRDIDIKFQLDGDPVTIVDSDGDELDILPDGSLPVTFAAQNLTTPNIANVTANIKNTEYSYTFPVNTKKYKISARGNSKIKLAFNSGESATNFVTIHPGNSYEESGLNVSITVYFQTSKDSEVIEILSWS